MKVLNLYAGLGGNRQLWQGAEVTAVEWDKNIASAYRSQFQMDSIIVGDAHQFLIDRFSEYDFVWDSPPCQSHTKFLLSGRNRTPCYPDMALYQEIIFLQTYFKGPWVVENVVPYYEPLIRPTFKIGRHLFWSNFSVHEVNLPPAESLMEMSIIQLQAYLGIHTDVRIYYKGNHDPKQVYRNCVHPAIGLHVYNAARKVLGHTEVKQGLQEKYRSSQISLFQ